METTNEYLSCTATAKLIREALKRHFPDVKFSVTSKHYSGGASIRVHWTNGPRTAAVEAITCRFQGAAFDAMQDLKTYTSTVVVGENGPRVILYGADYVFCARTVTDADRLEAEVDAMIRQRCKCEGDLFGTRRVCDLARAVVYDADFRDAGDAIERAYHRIVLGRSE